MEADSALRAQYPGMESLNDFEGWMQQKLVQLSAQTSTARPSVRTIPTVVHVIYSNSSENITDAQVISQIDVLNEDFRRLNADTTSTPSGFQPVAADCQVEFCLATIDPNGNPTNGIDRVSLSGSPFSRTYVDNTIKPTTVWDANNYFNIWVVNVGGGLLGWAQFPNSSGLSGLGTNNGNANTDGVVLLYTSVGRPPHNPFSGPYNLGRTATHEVGHWLGLRHIWGDGNCSQDDFCNDTPDSDNPNYACPTTHVSCSSTDMVQNYMDYTYDACMNIFTSDQKARMDVVLANSPRRASLLNSSVCGGTVGIAAAFTASTTAGCAPLSLTFTDQSTGPVTSWSWNFGDGNTSTTQNPAHTYASSGLYTVTLIVSDGTNYDTLTIVDYINVAGATSGIALPFSEDFEGGSFPPTAWTLVNPDGSTTWSPATVGGITPGTTAAKMDYYSYNAPGQRDGMVTPGLNFTGYSSISMDFDHAYRRYNSSASDSLIIYVSTGCGAPWQRVAGWGENGTGTFATSGTTTANWTPSNPNHWCFSGTVGTGCFTVDLTPYAGNSYVQIKIEGYNSYQNNLYVDNINITGIPAVVAPQADFSASSTTVCLGNSISFTDNSTNSPNSWSWDFGDGNSSGSQNPSHTYASAGTYTVTLIAGNAGGSDTEIKTNFVTVVNAPTLTASGTATTCGNNNGAATSSASGGAGSYTYAWSNGASTANISGLASGSYTVTVTDGAGCTDVQTVSVGASASVSASSSGNATTCGLNNGTASATGSGGTGSFSYAWSNGATAQNLTGLASGTYTVTITDGAGCTDVSTVSVGSSSAVSASGSGSSTTCGQNNGAATATGSGGTGSFTYAWSNGATAQNLSGLASGTYTVTITDGAGCADVASVNIGTSSGITASSSSGGTTCGQNNGSASAAGSGGTGTYTYAWNTGATAQNLTGLASGTYTVTVTDGAGCTDVSSVSVGSSTGVSASASATSTSCGQNNGSATASATGGTGSFTYAWSNGGSTSTITSLAAGTYSVTVTSGSCTDVSSVTVGNSSNLTASATSNATTCGQNNGSATASSSGGTGTITYAWSNGGTSQTISGLSSGTYTVTLTDGAGCTDVSTVAVGTSSAVTSSASASATSCGQNNGSATASGSGGTGSYTYAWSNGGSTAAISGIASGTYSVTVTDGAGCTDVSTVSVGASTAVSASTSGGSTSCGQNNGSAAVSASGGTGSYTTVWSTGATTASISNLAAGTYSVTVTDGGGCTDVASFTVGSSTAVTASASGNDPACGVSNGTATASATGGSGSYTYAWSTGGTSSSISGLGAGTYSVTVTDGSGCTDVSSVTLSSTGAPTVSLGTTPASCGNAVGSVSASATGGTGTYTYAWSTGGTSSGISGLPAGTYTVTVTDMAGCAVVSTATVSSTPDITLSLVNSQATTCNSNNGSATVNYSGGSGNVNISWSNGATGSTAIALPAGLNYAYAVDSLGCRDTFAVNIGAIPAPTVSASSTDISCADVADGAANAFVIGTGPFTFLWSNGATTDSINGLGAGTYTVQVTDSYGCVVSDTVVISQPTALLTSMSSNSESAPGANDGSASVSPVGGTPGYTYVWSNGGTNSTITGLAGGTYTVTVTDANGCETVDSVTVSTLTGVSAAALPGQVQIFPNPTSGKFTISYELQGQGPIEVRVVNAIGQMILERENLNGPAGSLEVDLTHKSAGVYLVIFRQGNTRLVKKVQVKR